VLSSDATMDARFSGAHSIIMQGIRSTMTLPLLHSSELLGIMHLDSLFTSNAFTEKDLQICTGMAAQAAISIQNARLASRIEREAQTRAQISRLIPPAVVEQVVKGQLTIEKGGRLNEITMLFSDIRGFTTMSEQLPPEETIELLNTYYTLMFDAISGQGGVVNQMVGDGLMAIFGAPLALSDPCGSAVRAARDMIEMVELFNLEPDRVGKTTIQIGIGIASGSMIAGYTGTDERATYTCVGDAVNVAARLEAHTKACGCAILIDGQTLAALDGAFGTEALGPVQFKGKTAAVDVFSVTPR
jgi:adenylate cyclase